MMGGEVGEKLCWTGAVAGVVADEVNHDYLFDLSLSQQ
jgi:hypothetical protein